MHTIEFTNTPPAHDVMYFLDCSVSSFHIPLDVYLWATKFHPNITQLVDSLDSMEDLKKDQHMSTLETWGAYLEKLYLEWQQDAPWEQVVLCLGYAIHYMPSIEHIVAETAGTLVDDSTGVFASLDYYKQYERHTSNGIVFYDGNKMLAKNTPHMQSLFRVIAQWDALEKKPDFSQFEIKFRPAPNLNELRNAVRSKKQDVRALPKETKRALKRSAEVLDSIAGESTSSLFLSGKEIIVTGQKYKFSLTKDPYGSIVGSHGACTTRVLCAATDEFIASLCIYTPKVTVFDHLASLVLHCNSGLEDVILMEANIIERGNIEKLPPAKLEEITRPRTPTEFLDFDIIEGFRRKPIESTAISKRKEFIQKKNLSARRKLVKNLALQAPWLLKVSKQSRISEMFPRGYNGENFIL